MPDEVAALVQSIKDWSVGKFEEKGQVPPTAFLLVETTDSRFAWMTEIQRDEHGKGALGKWEIVDRHLGGNMSGFVYHRPASETN